MSPLFVDLLWRWIVLVEKRLADAMADTATRTVEDVERERAVQAIHAALLTLGLVLPTVDELREQWGDDERRGRARVTGEPPITEVIE
jgi:hypothetical protein